MSIEKEFRKWARSKGLDPDVPLPPFYQLLLEAEPTPDMIAFTNRILDNFVDRMRKRKIGDQ